MKIYNRFLFVLALSFLLTTVILAAYGENRLDLYYSLYLIEGLVVTELFIYLHPKAKGNLSKILWILFSGFILIVVRKVLEILGGI